MADAKFKPKRITMRNTKKEMLQAYNEMLEHLKQQREAELRPEAGIEEKQIKQAVEVTDALSTERIVQELSGLKLEMGQLLGQVSERLEEEVARYRQVKKAVEVKEQELQEIYEIEKSALSLAALIDAQHQKREETEAELAARKEELTREIETLRAEWENEKKLHEAEIKERDAAEKKQREREREEYQYTFQREQQLAREQFEDEKARQEREIAYRREQMEREFAEREKAVAEKEGELEELRQRVSAFPKELESAVNKAVKEAVQRTELEAKSREELLTKQFEGERDVLTTRIDSLEKTVAEQSDQITKLSEQTDKAHGQVQTIAIKAIESAARSQPVSGTQPAATEQPRAPAQEKDTR